MQKLFVGRKSLLVHEILSLIRASQQINTTVTLRVQILKDKFNSYLGLPRAFCAYADLVAIKNLNCDALFRKHQSRTTSMRKGKIIGDYDKLVTWYKPKSCPKGLSLDEFDALPQTITVREIYYYITGFIALY